jgi:hypothetical protein
LSQSISFSASESEKLEKIFKHYTILKGGLIFLDQVEPTGLSYVQPYNEIRHSVDHLSRVILYKLGIHAPTDTTDYISKQLDKAYAHMYRAMYDTLDLLGLTIKESISVKLDPFSVNTKHTVMPEFYTKILPRLYTITEKEIVSLRETKDVGDDNEDNVVALNDLVAEMGGMLTYVNNHMPSLSQYEAGQHKSVIKERWWQLLLALIGGGVLTWLIPNIWNAFQYIPPK